MPYQNISLAEFARHIGMDAREVRRLADKGVLPGKQVGGQWRFNKAQMLEWLQREMHTLDPQHLRNLERAMSDGSDGVVLGTLLAPDGIEMNLPARSRPSVLRELVSVAERTGMVYDRDVLVASLEERESLCSTALPGGIAFPHPRQPMPYATAEPLVCMARVAAGIPYGAPDGRLTYLFVFVCCHDERQHLQTLARLSLMFHSDLSDELIGVDDSAEALNIFLQRERELLRAER